VFEATLWILSVAVVSTVLSMWLTRRRYRHGFLDGVEWFFEGDYDLQRKPPPEWEYWDMLRTLREVELQDQHYRRMEDKLRDPPKS